MALSEILSVPKTLRLSKTTDEKHVCDGVFTKNRQRVMHLNREENRKLRIRLQTLKRLEKGQIDKTDRNKKRFAERKENISAYQTALETIRAEKFETICTNSQKETNRHDNDTAESHKRRHLEFQLLRYGYDCPQMKREIERIRQENDPKRLKIKQMQFLKEIEKSKNDILLSRHEESYDETLNDFRRRRGQVADAGIYKLTEVSRMQLRTKTCKK